MTTILFSPPYPKQGCDNVPPGYEAVPLIEALNGPSVAPLQPTAPPAHDLYVQLPQSPADVPADAIVRNEASRYFSLFLSMHLFSFFKVI